MTPDEAAKILGMIEAAYPRGPWPEDTEALWLMELLSYDAELALCAVRRLVDSVTFTPAWAQFIEAVGLERSARRRDRDTFKALPPAPPDPKWKRNIEHLRSIVRGTPPCDADGVVAVGS